MLARDPRPGDHPRAGPGRGGREAAGHRGRGRALRPPGLHALPRRCATASGPSKIAFLAWHAWRDADAGEWPPGLPRGRRTSPTTWPTIRQWLEVFVQAVLRFSQFKRSRAAQRSQGRAPAGRCRPRGDWRAPSRRQRHGLARRARAATSRRPDGDPDARRVRLHRRARRPGTHDSGGPMDVTAAAHVAALAATPATVGAELLAATAGSLWRASRHAASSTRRQLEPTCTVQGLRGLRRCCRARCTSTPGR